MIDIVILIPSYKSTTLGIWNMSEFQFDQRSSNEWNDCLTAFLFLEDLISKIYLSDHKRKPDQWFSEHAILSCENDDVDHVNSDILDMFSGE